MSEIPQIPTQRKSPDSTTPSLGNYNLLVANEKPTGRMFQQNLAVLRREFRISENQWINLHYVRPFELQLVRTALRRYDPEGRNIYRNVHDGTVPELQQAIVRDLRLSEVALDGVVLFEHAHKDPSELCVGEVITDAVIDHYKYPDSGASNFGAFYHDKSGLSVMRLEQRRDDAAHSDVGNTVRQWSLSKT
jgi:hypothetical protein